MRVVFDLRGAQERRYPERGIPRYVAGHAEAVCEHSGISQIYGIVDPSHPLPAVAETVAARGELISIRDLSRLVRAEPPLVRAEAPLVHHVSSPFDLRIPRDQLLPSELRRPGVVRAVTLYDVIPLAFLPTVPSLWERRMWAFRAELVRSADIVLCISQFTAADGIKRLGLDPRRVRVINGGIAAVDADALNAMRTLPALPGLEKRFVLFAGGVEDPRKNVEALLRAFARLDPALRGTHQLVVVSRLDSGLRDQLLAAVRRAGVEDRVLMPGYVSDGLLRALFATCRCFVYPSLYEGLGLPILEAMSYGAPTITSKTTACGEVAAHPDATFDPTDVADISAAMARVLSDHELERTLRDYGRRRAAQYTWDRVADRTVAAYAEAVAAQRRRLPRRPETASVVFVSHSAPTPTAPANALLLMAAAISRRVRVSFATPAALRRRQLGFRVVDSAQLHEALPWLEGPLVCLADSPYAAARSAELLAERPGIVILWDLEQLIPDTGSADRAATGVGQLRDLASVAQGLVVGSAFDATRVKLAIGPRSRSEPAVLPPPLGWLADGRLGHELSFEAASLLRPERQAVRSRRPVRLLVAPRRPAFGPFEAEEIELAADLAIALSRRGRQARVQLLGKAPLESVARAQRRCAGVGGRLAHADWPIFGQFAAWTTAADMFLELGRASAAAARATTDHALLAGRPALVVGHRTPGTSAVGLLPGSASGVELGEATVAMLLAPPADRAETLRHRNPDSAAESLLRMLGIGEGETRRSPAAAQAAEEETAAGAACRASSMPASRALGTEPSKQASTSQ